MGNRIKNVSLAQPFLSFLKGMLFVVIITVTILGYVYVKNNYTNSLLNDMSLSLTSCNNTVNAYLESVMQSTSRLSKSLEIAGFLNQTTTKDQLADYLKKSGKGSHAIIILDAHNNPVFATNEQLSLYNNDVLQASLQRTLILFRPDISDFFLNPHTNIPAIFVTEPIIWQKKLLGFVATEISTQDLQKIVEQYSQLTKTSEIFVGKKINDAIKTVLPTRFKSDITFKNIVDLKPSIREALEQSVVGKQGATRSSKLLLAWNYVPLTQWGIVATAAQSDVMQELLSLHIFLFCIVSLSALLACYFIYKSWTHQHGPELFRYISFQLLFYTMYSAFIATIVSLVLHTSHYYHIKQGYNHTSSINFKIALHTAVQNVNAHASTIEITTNMIALDVPIQAITEPTKTKIIELIRNNNDIQGVVVALKNNTTWDFSLFSRTNNEVTAITDTIDEKQNNWLKNSLISNATWGTYEINKEVYPLYTAQLVSHTNGKQQYLRGVIGIIYNRQTILDVIREVISDQPLFLTLNDGRIVYADKVPGLPTHALQVEQTSVDNTIIERIPHIGWYLGSILPKTPVYDSALVRFLFHICIICITSIILAYSIVYCVRSQKISIPLYGLLIAVALTIIRYWVG